MRSASATNRLSLPLLVTLCFWVAGGGASDPRRTAAAHPAASLVMELWGRACESELASDARPLRYQSGAPAATLVGPQLVLRRHVSFLLPPIRAPGV